METYKKNQIIFFCVITLLIVLLGVSIYLIYKGNDELKSLNKDKNKSKSTAMITMGSILLILCFAGLCACAFFYVNGMFELKVRDEDIFDPDNIDLSRMRNMQSQYDASTLLPISPVSPTFEGPRLRGGAPFPSRYRPQIPNHSRKAAIRKYYGRDE